jgi:hypothetical protein
MEKIKEHKGLIIVIGIIAIVVILTYLFANVFSAWVFGQLFKDILNKFLWVIY